MNTNELVLRVFYFLAFLVVIDFLFPDSKEETKNGTTGNVSTERKTPSLLSFFVKKQWKTNVSYTKLVKEIIHYTGTILLENKVKYYPTFDIKYYKSKKYMGIYYGSNDHISIYLKSHEDIPSIVDTVLHEVCHHIQNKSRNKEFKLYNSYSNSFGYRDNPLEVDSRAFAAKWTLHCLDYLESRNIISNN
jgi:hypothetical protein